MFPGIYIYKLSLQSGNLSLLMILLNTILRFLKPYLPLILAWVLTSFSTSAQHLGYKKYTVDDGLIQSEVVSIVQDSNDFFWTDTKFVASKFDGNKFVIRFDSLDIRRYSLGFIDEILNAASSAGYVFFEPDGHMTAYKNPFFSPYFILSQWVDATKTYVAFVQKQEIQIIRQV